MLVLITVLLPLRAYAQYPLQGDMSDLSPVDNWRKLANGVYTAAIGDADAELRYSDLAGRRPKWMP